jgi:hypothetical protein
MPAPTKHSKKYSPSKSSIWLNCPPSTLLNEGLSQEARLQIEFDIQRKEFRFCANSKLLSLVDYNGM